MSARKSFAAALAAAVAGSALVMTAGPASAVYAADPDDTTLHPDHAPTSIGVGSDTTQHALKLIADAWNAGARHGLQDRDLRRPTARAPAAAPITLPGGADPRPNGSGAGKTRALRPGNIADVDFARSSSALEHRPRPHAGLKAFPFALDTLVMAVSQQRRPRTRRRRSPLAQILDIYEGTITNWTQFGGTAGDIEPAGPAGRLRHREASSTPSSRPPTAARSPSRQRRPTVQEHDDDHDQGRRRRDRADLEGPRRPGRRRPLRVETGFAAKRALYNVVRGTDVANAPIQAVFGENGFVCSTAATTLIEAAGFEQLATAAPAAPAARPPSRRDQQLHAQRAGRHHDHPVAATSPAANAAKVVAHGHRLDRPERHRLLLRGRRPCCRRTSRWSPARRPCTLARRPPGSAHLPRRLHARPPDFARPSAPDGHGRRRGRQDQARDLRVLPGQGEAQEGEGQGRRTVKGAVTVKGATGKVTVKKGKKTLKSATLKGGKASVTLPKLKKGTYKLTIAYAGDAEHLAGTKTFTIKVVK